MDYKIIIYVIFGLLPSLTWLSYYLRKDMHPEPKKMIVKMFLWGAVVTLPVFFVQIGLAMLLAKANLNALATALIYWFIVISLTEEVFKYLIVRLKAINSPDMDEPLDIMLYMVVAALGFAALENILYLFVPLDQLTLNEIMTRTLLITVIRFIGATFLHTLCSALIGYAVAVSIMDQKRRAIEMSSGIFMATLLHGVYDFSIMQLDGYAKIAVPAITIIVLAFLVFSAFEKLKKVKSVTILNTVKT